MRLLRCVPGAYVVPLSYYFLHYFCTLFIHCNFFQQYFNNEQFEANKYDRSLKKYEDASLKTSTSLAFLNFGQNAIFSGALSLIMVMAAHQITGGTVQIISLSLQTHTTEGKNVKNIMVSVPLFKFRYHDCR